MNRLCLSCLLFAGFSLANAQTAAQPQPAAPEPKTAMEWFQRASEQLNLRTPGAAPFHMKVTFHAYPGLELLGAKEKSDFVSGDGVYEEQWLSPHEWRREITLADYHAVEEMSAGVRKMQASSDYEPSRVLMLLEALYSPIPRYLTSKEFPRSGWKVDHIANANLSLVRISHSFGNQRGDFSDAYYFLPRGVLAISNSGGLTKTWANDVLFSNLVVPRTIVVKAGDRVLLSADVAIEAAAKVDPASFDLSGPAAEPGMTLRPLYGFEVKIPDLSEDFGWMSATIDSRPTVFDFLAILDRHGRFREPEVLLAPNQKDAAMILAHFRGAKHHPAEIDGSPCQVVITTVTM